jgi:hypothetical protein
MKLSALYNEGTKEWQIMTKFEDTQSHIAGLIDWCRYRSSSLYGEAAERVEAINASLVRSAVEIWYGFDPESPLEVLEAKSKQVETVVWSAIIAMGEIDKGIFANA